MSVDPQQIPFAPQAQNPVPPFQGGPYAQVASEAIARQTRPIDWAQTFGQQGNDLLQNFLRMQQLRQQGPLVQAQTAEARANTQGALQKQYLDQPTSPYPGGTSPSAPPPSGSYPGMDQTQPGQSMSPSGGQGPTSGGGFSPQMPMTVQPSGYSQQIGPAGQGAGPNDPFAHMHMDPSQPGILHGGPMGLQSQQQQPFQPMVPRSQLYGIQQDQANRSVFGKAYKASPLFKKYMGDLSGISDEDVGRLGDPEKIIGPLANIEANAAYRDSMLGIQGKRTDIEGQRVVVEQNKNTQDQITHLQDQQTNLVKDLPSGIVSSFMQGQVPSDKYKATYQQWQNLQDRIDQLQGNNKNGASKKLSSIDQQALNWANSNPTDPRAKQIKQKLGIQ